MDSDCQNSSSCLHPGRPLGGERRDLAGPDQCAVRLSLCNEEAAFSNYRLWESIGFIFGLATNAVGVYVFTKIITTIVFLGLGMLGYLILELLEKRKNPK